MKISGPKKPAENKEATELTVTLPLPPTVNSYWRYVGGRVLLSARGRQYKECVRGILADAWRRPPLLGRLVVSVGVEPPNRARRDLDNLLKSLLDAIEGAVYADDGQIDSLRIWRGAVRQGGQVTVRIEELPDVENIVVMSFKKNQPRNKNNQ